MGKTNEHEQLRRAQLMIAREIKRICEKYNINYFLDSGSMLGAVRHGGFIPWDDDMDIGMPKEDYKKFLEVAQQELGDKYFVDNYNTNDENSIVFTKIRLVGTKYIEKIGNKNNKHNEIFVDIFSYYYISDNRWIRKFEGLKMQIYSHMLLIKGGYKVWKGKSVLKHIKFMPIQVCAIFFSKKSIRNKIEKLYDKYSETAWLGERSGITYGYWWMPNDVFDEYIDVSFENEIFKIPKKYEEFLKIAYGDYMKLPPESERITHEVEEIDFGEYKFY